MLLIKLYFITFAKTNIKFKQKIYIRNWIRLNYWRFRQKSFLHESEIYCCIDAFLSSCAKSFRTTIRKQEF